MSMRADDAAAAGCFSAVASCLLFTNSGEHCEKEVEQLGVLFAKSAGRVVACGASDQISDSMPT